MILHAIPRPHNENPAYDGPVSDELKKLRFLSIAQAAEELNLNQNPTRALLSSGDLRGIQVRGRGYLGQIVGSNPSLPDNPVRTA